MAGNGMVKAVFLVGLVVTVMTAWGVVRTEGAISCNQVVSALTPCAGYLIGNAATPAPACCAAIKGLDSQVKATPDRQAVCNFLKNQATSFGVKLGRPPISLVSARSPTSTCLSTLTSTVLKFIEEVR